MLVFEDRGNWRTQRKVSWGQIKCKNQQSIFSPYIWHHQQHFIGRLLPSWLHNFNSDFNHNRGKGYSGCIITGLSLRSGGRRFPRLLSKENRRKIEPKQALSCLIPCLLFVCIQQIKISDNAVLATRFQGLKPKKQD